MTVVACSGVSDRQAALCPCRLSRSCGLREEHDHRRSTGMHYFAYLLKTNVTNQPRLRHLPVVAAVGHCLLLCYYGVPAVQLMTA